MLNFQGSMLRISLIQLPIFELLIIRLFGEETSCPHFVTSREHVKIHVHFLYVCGTCFAIDTSYLLWLKEKDCTRVGVDFTWKG